MVTGRYRHFRNQKEYVALGNGVFGAPLNAELVGTAFDADNIDRRINVYRCASGFVLEDIGEIVRPAGLVCVIYQAQYSDSKLGEKPLFVRRIDGFLANVTEGSYSGPRFIPLSNH